MKLLFTLLFCIIFLQKNYAQSAQTLLEQGDELTTQGDYGKALKKYDQAIKIDARFAIAYHQRSQIYYKLNENKKAVADCLRALELNPNLTEVYFNLAIARFYDKDFEKSIADFTNALSVNPKDKEALFWRGMAFLKMNDKKNACKDWKKARQMGYFSATDMINEHCEGEAGAQGKY